MSVGPTNGVKPTIVIHTNDAQLVAARVGAYSLKSRSKHPALFDVRLLRLEDTPYLYRRYGQRFVWWSGNAPTVFHRRNTQSFSALRRMVPELLGFRGRALVLDPDVFAIGDVWELLSRNMDGKAILCCQKPVWRDGRRLYSSAVMLLDCDKLTHWQWEREIDDIFRGVMPFGPWLSLLDESPERIGILEDEWNHCDTLTDQTKLLHNTELTTQPWKTGLPADYNEHAPRWPPAVERLLGIARRLIFRGSRSPLIHQPHPDPRQEQLFFTLLKECLDAGVITQASLRRAMRRNYLRKDTFALVDALSAPPRGSHDQRGHRGLGVRVQKVSGDIQVDRYR
jgi:hypothetical protein